MMTVAEIQDHAQRLQEFLELRRGQVQRGEYRGNRTANEALVSALEGRVAELLAQCETLSPAV